MLPNVPGFSMNSLWATALQGLSMQGSPWIQQWGKARVPRATHSVTELILRLDERDIGRQLNVQERLDAAVELEESGNHFARHNFAEEGQILGP